MHWVPIHCSAFFLIGMDTYPLIAAITGAATDVVTRQDPALSSITGRQTLAPGGFPASDGQANDGEKSCLMPTYERAFAAR